jgi:signal transduction histidine kinase
MLDVMQSLDQTTNAVSPPCFPAERFQSMDGLTASIVHDLRSPLTAICGCAEMLLEARLDAVQSRRVTTNIHRAAGRMRDLLTALTSLARGCVETRTLCNLHAVLESAIEVSGVSDRSDIHIHLHAPCGIEMTLACAQVQRVLVNLILNAMEAMQAGGEIGISAMVVGKYVRIEVEDNGPGIPPQIRKRLFEPFVTAGKKDGLGLGLTLSRQTIEDHGGELWLEAAAGARFVFSLPLENQPGFLR